MLRTTVDSYIYAYGLFQDVWAPVLEAVLNLGLSICLGYFWSLNGIVLGINTQPNDNNFDMEALFSFRKGDRSRS